MLDKERVFARELPSEDAGREMWRCHGERGGFHGDDGEHINADLDDPISIIESPDLQPDEDAPIEEQIAAAEMRGIRQAWMTIIPQIHAMFGFIRAAGNDCGQAMRVTICAQVWGYQECASKTVRELAAMHGKDGTTRANFVKHMNAYQKYNGLPKLPAQKSEEASEAYSEARNRQLRTK